MHQIELEEDCINGVEPSGVNYRNATDYVLLVGELRQQFNSGKIECIHLFNYGKINLDEPPVKIEVTSYKEHHNLRVPDKCRFYTSHYIGHYGNSKVSISIGSRFGKFSYFLGYVANVFLPIGISGTASNNGNSYWLLAILWKSLLNNALTNGQIPRTYVEERKNLKSYRGRLDIPQNIRNNLVDYSRFYCVYRKLSMDNTINRAVRHAYRVLNEKGLFGILADISAFDQRLESFGVKDVVSNPKELDNIRFTRMNAVYQPVINLCKTIIKNDASSFEGGDRNNVSYIIDVA